MLVSSADFVSRLIDLSLFKQVHFESINCLFVCFITGADSLAYLSVEGLKRAVQYNMKRKNRAESGHCTACLTGEYPGGVPEELSW